MFQWDPVFETMENAPTKVVYKNVDPMVVDQSTSTSTPQLPQSVVQSTSQSVVQSTSKSVVQSVSKVQQSEHRSQLPNPVLIKWGELLPTGVPNRRVVDCRSALPHPIEIWLGAAKPLSNTDLGYKYNTKYYKDQPNDDHEHPYWRDENDAHHKYFVDSYKEWMGYRERDSKKYAEQAKKAKADPPKLDRLLSGQLPQGCRYEAGDYEPIGVPIEVYADGVSPLIMAAHKTFTEHRPLTLRPDDLLLPIVQAVGIYLLSLDPNVVREKYFKRNGRTTLVVDRPEFVMGKEDNQWDQVFSEFANLITQELGPEARNGLRAQFTTTGPFQDAAYDIALMNACRFVFSYQTHTMCGIPVVELDGTPDDWITLGDKILFCS